MEKENKTFRIGAVNWDACLPLNTYFGRCTANALCNQEYANRLPYYAVKNEDGSYSIPERTQAQYDEELCIAADAGIDFFMYCWYPDGPVTDRTVGTEGYEYLMPYLHELNKMRKMYQASPSKNLVKMAAIIIAVSAYSESDIVELVSTMKEDYYEKVDGRPLVFIYGGYKTEFIDTIRCIAEKESLDPYVVFMCFMGPGKHLAKGDYSKADAVSGYSTDYAAADFESFCVKTAQANVDRKASGLPVIPMLGAGWNPQPRIDRVCPWATYPVAQYAPAPTTMQMEKATRDFLKELEDGDTEYGVVFAWTEFEEGGYLCPVLGLDDKPNYEILNGFSRAIRACRK